MKLTERYPKVKIEKIEEDKRLHIHNLWNDDSFILRFDAETNLDFLNELLFPEELMAACSIAKGYLEVFAYPIEPEDDLIKRKFDFNYKGKTYKCYWDKPTEGSLY